VLVEIREGDETGCMGGEGCWVEGWGIHKERKEILKEIGEWKPVG